MAKMTFRADDHIPAEGEWLSFSEWEKKGFGVRVGEKATRYINGVAVFHESQVLDINKEFDEFVRDELRGIGCGWDWWKD